MQDSPELTQAVLFQEYKAWLRSQDTGPAESVAESGDMKIKCTKDKDANDHVARIRQVAAIITMRIPNSETHFDRRAQMMFLLFAQRDG